MSLPLHASHGSTIWTTASGRKMALFVSDCELSEIARQVAVRFVSPVEHSTKGAIRTLVPLRDFSAPSASETHAQPSGGRRGRTRKLPGQAAQDTTDNARMRLRAVHAPATPIHVAVDGRHAGALALATTRGRVPGRLAPPAACGTSQRAHWGLIVAIISLMVVPLGQIRPDCRRTRLRRRCRARRVEQPAVDCTERPPSGRTQPASP